MNANELFMSSGKPAGIFFCEACRRVWCDKDVAESCCRCRYCGELEKNSHAECRYRAMHKRRAEVLEAAAVIENYDGWVYAEGCGYRDGYFPSMDDLLEYLAEEELSDWPERVHCCTPVTIRWPDASDIAERVCEGLYEEADNDLQGLKELDEALAEFAKANASMQCFEADYSRCVLVPRGAELGGAK